MDVTEKKKTIIAELLKYNLIISEEEFYEKIGIKKTEGIFINEIKRAYDIFNINPNFWLIDDQPIFHLSISNDMQLEKVKMLVKMLKQNIEHEKSMRLIAEQARDMYRGELQFHKLLPVELENDKEGIFADIDFMQLA